MINIDQIEIKDYDFELNEKHIAQEAIEPRDHSKLLVLKNNKITDEHFYHLHHYIPNGSTLVINDAKVIPARLFFKNQNGANIEVFLLQPYNSEYTQALQSNNECTWKCLIGNKKKWKSNEKLTIEQIQLTAELMDMEGQIVKFSWENKCSFIQLLEQIGNMPLPPYIKKRNKETDKNRYQTVYSKTEGSVAAPTAGLHFTDHVFQELANKNTSICRVTLHVSAGTFLPVTSAKAVDHPMHSEFFSFTKSSIELLLNSQQIICVGTTSVRVTESLYYLATNLLNNVDNPYEIGQFCGYTNYKNTFENSKTALQFLLDYMNKNQLEEITGNTSIMIMPGYQFQFLNGLITNFHQPKSTLLLLISAFIGERWREVYQHAIEQQYRFYSYGDSSLLF